MNDDLTIEFDRQIAASPANVWRCLTEPDLVAQWFAPKPVVISDVQIDLTPGGIFSLVMTMPDNPPMKEPPGCFLVIEPETRLVWTSALGPEFVPNPPHENPKDFYMTADLRLSAKDGGCHYQVRALHASKNARDLHRDDYGFLNGWGTAADQMADLAKTL